MPYQLRAPRSVAAACLLAAILANTACDEKTEEPVVDPPVISGISPTTASPGDTITVDGDKFDPEPTANRIVFHNPIAVARAFEGSRTSLRVVVPPDAASGPVSANANGVPSVQTGPTLTVPRAVADVWTWGGTGASRPLTLDFTVTGSEYLVVTHGANLTVPTNQPLSYTLTPSGAGAPGALGAPPTSPACSPIQARLSFGTGRDEEPCTNAVCHLRTIGVLTQRG